MYVEVIASQSSVVFLRHIVFDKRNVARQCKRLPALMKPCTHVAHAANHDIFITDPRNGPLLFCSLTSVVCRRL